MTANDPGSRSGPRPALRVILAVIVACGLAPAFSFAQDAGEAASASPAAATDIGWPREVRDGDRTLTVYQPQLDAWTGNRLSGRAAISVATAASPAPSFGVLWFTARTDVDKTTRLVTLEDLEITRASFPTKSAETDAYVQAIRGAFATGARTISLDRLEANLSVTQAEQGHGSTVAVENTPPRIYFSETPAILVLVDGKPALRPVPGSTSLLRAINTRALLLLDQASGRYFLFAMNDWASAGSLDGPWSAATDQPAGLEAAKQAATSAGHVDLLTDPPGAAKAVLEEGDLPAIFVATGPAELIQTSGAPDYQPIAGTQLLSVQNSSSDIFVDTANQTTYVLISGRWFRSTSLTGATWSYVPSDALPADFARIPWQHPKGSVLTSVAGTSQAEEARISSTVPQTATVQRASTQMPPPAYDGEPRFEPIPGTSLSYAQNTATPVIRTAPSTFFAVLNGVWFTAVSPSGPWVVADAVPPSIYAIPPSSPLYYVTWVRVYGATPQVVYVGYTPGYFGTYVAPTGTVVYGTGYVYDPWIGDVWIGPPYTYGFGAGFAWGSVTGFALGVAAGAYCHPWWGPAGWGWGYGSWSNRVSVDVNHANVYGRWGGNSVVWGNDRYAGRVGDTRFVGEKGGDVYAGHDGDVYRRQDGTWQKWNDGGWSDTQARADAQQRARDDDFATTAALDREASARQAGDDRWNSFTRARPAGDGDADRWGGFGGGYRAGGYRSGGYGGYRAGGYGGMRGGFRR